MKLYVKGFELDVSLRGQKASPNTRNYAPEQARKHLGGLSGNCLS